MTPSKPVFSWSVVCLRSNSSEVLERESNSESNRGWTLSLFICIFISISNFQIVEPYKEESVCFLISLLQCLCRGGISHWWALQAGGSQNWDREKGCVPARYFSKCSLWHTSFTASLSFHFYRPFCTLWIRTCHLWDWMWQTSTNRCANPSLKASWCIFSRSQLKG